MRQLSHSDRDLLDKSLAVLTNGLILHRLVEFSDGQLLESGEDHRTLDAIRRDSRRVSVNVKSGMLHAAGTTILGAGGIATTGSILVSCLSDAAALTIIGSAIAAQGQRTGRNARLTSTLGARADAVLASEGFHLSNIFSDEFDPDNASGMTRLRIAYIEHTNAAQAAETELRSAVHRLTIMGNPIGTRPSRLQKLAQNMQRTMDRRPIVEVALTIANSVPLDLLPSASGELGI